MSADCKTFDRRRHFQCTMAAQREPPASTSGNWGVIGAALFLSAIASALAGCGERKNRITVVIADGIVRPFQELKREFEKDNAGLEVALEPFGSVLACRRLQSDIQADVIALADHRLFDEMLFPKGLASWAIGFATTEIVIIKSTQSRYNAEIDDKNWFEVLARPGVMVGLADPTMDPCGYWTILCWKLADKHYGRTEPGRRISEILAAKCTPEYTRPDAMQLVSLVTGAGGWDYAFVYRAHAEQLRVSFVPLPPQINLGDPTQAELYAGEKVEVPKIKVTRTGEPLAFAIGIPDVARRPEPAERFVRFVLSERGREICRKAGLPVIDKPWSRQHGKLPESFRSGVVEKRDPR